MRVVDQEVRTEPIDAVHPHPRNPRRGDVAAILQSIETNGFYGAIVAQRGTGYILAGNHRWLAAQGAGATEIPVVWIDVDDETATRILLADNRTNDAAGYDDAALAEVLQQLEADTGTLTGTGYDADDMRALLSALSDGADDGSTDAEAEANGVEDEGADETQDVAETRTTAGDLWAVGPHRLLVGDCRDAEVQRKLFAGDTPDTIFFDPPFQWDRVYEWIPPHVADQAVTLIVFADAFRVAESILAATERGWRFRFELVWDGLSSWYTAGRPLARHKVALLFGGFNWDFDAAVFLNKDGESKHLTTVYPQGNSGVEGGHSHAKPLSWITPILGGVGAAVVWDMCAGSGTTLVAASRIGARVLATEIDPATADILLTRWDACDPGRAAVRVEIGDGVSAPLPKDPDAGRYERSRFYRSAGWLKLRKAALERDGYRCRSCGCSETVDRLQVDHIQTRKHGGSDEMDNLQTLCHSCHSRKTGATT